MTVSYTHLDVYKRQGDVHAEGRTFVFDEVELKPVRDEYDGLSQSHVGFRSFPDRHGRRTDLADSPFHAQKSAQRSVDRIRADSEMCIRDRL